jgi:predicted PurR-regulated permease PerM
MAEDFYRRTRYVVFTGAVVVFACAMLWMAREILLLFFAAMVDWMIAHSGLTRMWALVVVCGGVLLGLVMALWLRGPAIVAQFGELAAQVPESSRRVWDLLSRQSWAQWLTARVATPGQISSFASFVLGKMGNAITDTASFTIGSLVVMFATLYLSSEPEAYLELLFRVIPVEHRLRSRKALEAVAKTLRSWMVAKAISMASIGIFISIGLSLLQIPLALTLGAVAALLTFIPNVGAIASVIPAALLAFATSPRKGVLTVMLFVMAHFLEGNVVTPLAEREFAKTPPAITLGVQLILGMMSGGLGVTLAAPLTAVGLCLLRFFTSGVTREEA